MYSCTDLNMMISGKKKSEKWIARYQSPTLAMNYKEEKMKEFVSSSTNSDMSQREMAVSLYYAVRDEIRYDPYSISLSIEGMSANSTLNERRGWCVPKAVLLAAGCRAVGIPARLGFADVKNHLSTKKLRERMQTDIFYWHGYTEIYLDEKWVKATPAFNLDLCQKMDLTPLDFDGSNDAIFHPFDNEGNAYMEYVHYRGSFEDLPLVEIIATFEKYYPKLLETTSKDFDQDVHREMPMK